MQLGPRIQETLSLYEHFDHVQPADNYLHFAMKARRYIGGSDRRAIRDMFYKLLRHQIGLEAKLHVLAKKHHLFPYNLKLGLRWMMLIAFKEAGDEEALATFTGEPYHPDPLSEDEKKILFLCPISLSDAAASLNLTPFWHEKLLAQFKEELPQYVSSLQEEAPLDLRVNTLKISRDQGWELLRQEKVTSQDTPFAPYGLRIHEKASFPNELVQKGLFEPQDEGSQLITLACDVKPGMRVVDFCAGAGGKTLGLAMQMENKGQIIALDVMQSRLDRAKLRLRRLGIHNVTQRIIDPKWIKKQSGTFDRVLVDAPCSGSGTWRRNPDLKNKTTESDVMELVQKQREILKDAARLVKSEGLLIYATCSLVRDENDDQIEWFLENYPDFDLINLSLSWPLQSPTPSNTPTWSLTPYKHKMDGFFVACMVRRRTL